jgi:PiT family inorganic phosphate transporter
MCLASAALCRQIPLAAGGWRIMKPMGHKIIKLNAINGVAAETAGSIVILSARYCRWSPMMVALAFLAASAML